MAKSSELKELTGPQVMIVASEGELLRPSAEVSYKKLREMRRDPTISLARRLMLAPVLAAPWSIEAERGAPDGAKEFIAEQMQPLRTELLEVGFLGCTDFGWQPFEKVFTTNAAMEIIISKIKPLLQDFTKILVNDTTGAYEGLRQEGDSGVVELEEARTILLNIGVEGTNWYGTSTLANAESAYDRWLESDTAATRYGTKIAGAHWVVYYPTGQTAYGSGGELLDNFEIAKRILQNLQASGAVCLPATPSSYTDTLDAGAYPQWKIELLSDTSGPGAFTDREKYLDALKVRAMGFPERAILEGQFGTKAEAEVHSQLGIIGMDTQHRKIVQQLNKQCVNDLLTFNYGPDTINSVYVEPAPITDLALSYLQKVYTEFLKGDSGRLQELEGVDFPALRDRLGIPVLPDEDFDSPGFVPSGVLPQEEGVEGIDEE